MYPERIQILLASTRKSAFKEITRELELMTRLRGRVWQCQKLEECLNLIKEKGSHIDIVLLDLGLMAHSGTEDVFKQIQNAVHDAPIIVFTREEDHDLALFVVEEGAVDNVIVSDGFTIEANKLRDSVEFSWLRHKISERKRKQASADIEEEREKGDAALKAGSEKNAIDLESEKKQSVQKMEDKDEFISWVTGGYSVQPRREK